MKICLLTSEFAPFHGGIGSYAREIALAAAAAGHQVTMLAPDYGEDRSVDDAMLPFRVVRFRGGPSNAKGLFRRVLVTRQLLTEERFDLIHAVDWPFFIPLRLVRKLQRQARILLTVHGTEIIYMQAFKRRLLLDLIGFWQRGWADWIANSHYTKNLLLKAFPAIGTRHVQAIPLAVSDRWRAARIDRTTARRDLGLRESDFVMISLGRIVPRKGHGVIAQALGQLPQAVARDLVWWIVGPFLEKEYVEQLRLMTAPLSIPVQFLGSLPNEEVQRRLSAADFFCLPGYQDESGRVEGFGLVFLEAAAYGVPSIATRSGGIPEAVKDGKTGILIAEHDSEALAAAIVRLKEDDELREEMARAAEAKAASATWDRVMRETYEG